MMKQAIDHPATGFVLALAVVATVLLVPPSREILFVSFGWIRDTMAAIPGSVVDFVRSIF